MHVYSHRCPSKALIQVVVVTIRSISQIALQQRGEVSCEPGPLQSEGSSAEDMFRIEFIECSGFRCVSTFNGFDLNMQKLK